MLSHFRRRACSFGRFGGRVLFGSALAGAVALTGCDKVPLLAPSGSVITLIATSNVLAANGSIDIVATVIEQGATSSGESGTSTAGQGTPVHNGTVVTFTTTIGTLEPREARTHNGQVTVKLNGDGRSGVAKITAYSGGASASLDVNVGAAAAERIVLTGTPLTLGPTGGTVQLSARVEDVSGNGLSGIELSFNTSAGTVTPASASTDDTGVARASLVTTRGGTVTAEAGGKTSNELTVTLADRTGISITAPTTSPAAGSPANFTIGVSATANIRSVTVEWGDGGTTLLGALSASTTVPHIYNSQGTYTVTAIATTADGYSESVSTVVTVTSPVPLAVTLAASSAQPVTGQTVTFTATTGAVPPGAVILRYDWDFGDGATTTTTSNVATHIYASPGTRDINVTVVLSNAATGTAVTTIIVTNPAPVQVTLSAVPNTATANVTIVRFTAQVGALPPGVSIVQYDWNFGDGVTDNGTSSPTHDYVYTTGGISGLLRTATVTVVLSNGTTAVGQAIVNVTP